MFLKIWNGSPIISEEKSLSFTDNPATLKRAGVSCYGVEFKKSYVVLGNLSKPVCEKFRQKIQKI